jgi:exopolysaccharide biosynthesis protein
MTRSKFIYLILIFSLIFSVSIYKSKFTIKTSNSKTKVTFLPTPNTTNAINPNHTANKLIKFAGQEFAYDYVKIDKTSKVNLIPNFDLKLTSTGVIGSNNCQILVNGGFYTTDYKPLGMFYSQNNLIRSYQKNSLIDAVFSQDLENNNLINFDKPEEDSSKWIIQTGPMLVYNKEKLNIKIRDDKNARRIIGAIDANNNLIFMAMFSENNPYSGPLLADLPDIILEINSKEKLEIIKAVNLDGGSASAFITNNTKLSELSTLGSSFCIK